MRSAIKVTSSQGISKIVSDGLGTKGSEVTFNAELYAH